MEDDYGMIDGIINNGPKEPTVAQLEQQASREAAYFAYGFGSCCSPGRTGKEKVRCGSAKEPAKTGT